MSHFCETSTDVHTPTKTPSGCLLLSNSVPPNTILPSSSCSSPASTYSDFGNNNPLALPTSYHHYVPPSGDRLRYVGGLDFPINMHGDDLKSAATPAPPLTIANVSGPFMTYGSLYGGTSPTSPFPQVEGDFFYYPHTSDLSDDSDSSDVQSPLFGAFTPSSQSSCSTLQSPPPLSPVSPDSPEWPLFSSYGNSPPRDHDLDALPLPLGDSDRGGIFPHHLGQTDIKSPKRSSSLLSNQWRYYNNSSYPDGGHPLFCPEICGSPKPICLPLDPIDTEGTALPPLPFDCHHPYGKGLEATEQQTDNNDHEAVETKQQQSKTAFSSLPAPATMPYLFSPLTHSDRLPKLVDDEMDVHFPDLFDNVPPPSPSGRSYAALPDDNGDLLSDSTLYPSSDEDTNADLLDSPTLSLLSLPGADIDEDLIFPDPILSRPAPEIKSSPYTNRLLVLDDSLQSDNQRSPSPEPCALLDISHLKPEMQDDEEMRRVFGLLKRVKGKERAARQLENVIEREERVARSIGDDASGSGAVSALMDARRRTKRMRDKVREVAILLRLNLARRGLTVSQDESGKVILEPATPSSPVVEDAVEVGEAEESQTSKASLVSSKKPPIRSSQHLLVRMMLDRHEPKYNANLRAGLPLSRKAVSPLRRAWSNAEEMESESVAEHEGATSDASRATDSKYPDSISSFNFGFGLQSTDPNTTHTADDNGASLEALDLDLDFP